MRPQIFLILILVLSMATSACDGIPVDVAVDAKIDTGEKLKQLMADTMEDLQEALRMVQSAEQIAGTEARTTLRDAMSQLETYTVEVDQLVGDRLDHLIVELDALTQKNLRFIQQYTENVRDYALEIIHGIGEESRETIATAVSGMRVLVAQTEGAIENTTATVVGATLIVVNSVLDTSVKVGAVVLAFLIVAIWLLAYGWKWLHERGDKPFTGYEKWTIAIVAAVALLPTLLLVDPVRAWMLGNSNWAKSVQLLSKPHVISFEPDPLVLASSDEVSSVLVVRGSNLVLDGRYPAVSFGTHALRVNGSDVKLDVDVAPVASDPLADDHITFQFGEDNTVRVWTIAVQTATPAPTPLPTTTVPSVSGLSQESARQAIESYGLEVTAVVTTTDRLAPIGGVLGSVPGQGDVVPVGSAVTLVIAAGSLVPNVTGLEVNEARAALVSAGFEVAWPPQYAVSEEAGVASEQALFSDPAGGSLLEPGHMIRLTVSKGQPCAIGNDTIPPKITERWFPPLMNGDGEFDGHGPAISITNAHLYVTASAVMSTFYLTAQETDWYTCDEDKLDFLELWDLPCPKEWMTVHHFGDTSAYGQGVLTIASLTDESREWRRLIGTTEVKNASLTDDGTSADLYYFSTGPVDYYELMGDRMGIDVYPLDQRRSEDGTSFRLATNPLIVQFINTSKCAAAHLSLHFGRIELTGLDPATTHLAVDIAMNGVHYQWRSERMNAGTSTESNQTLRDVDLNKDLSLTLSGDETLAFDIKITPLQLVPMRGFHPVGEPIHVYTESDLASNEWNKGSRVITNEVNALKLLLETSVEWVN